MPCTAHTGVLPSNPNLSEGNEGTWSWWTWCIACRISISEFFPRTIACMTDNRVGGVIASFEKPFTDVCQLDCPHTKFPAFGILLDSASKGSRNYLVSVAYSYQLKMRILLRNLARELDKTVDPRYIFVRRSSCHMVECQLTLRESPHTMHPPLPVMRTPEAVAKS